MNKIISIVKNNKIELFLFLAVQLETFVLYGNILLFLICSLVSLILSLYLLSKKEEYLKQIKIRNSSYHFFYVLVKNLFDGQTLKAAYSSAAKYLISYQEVIPFEEISKEHSLKMYEYQEYFDYLFSEDKKNELTLKNTSSLLLDVENKISFAEETESKIRFRFKQSLFLILIGLLLSILLSCFSNMKVIYSLPNYLIPTCICLPLLFPSALYFQAIHYKKGLL